MAASTVPSDSKEAYYVIKKVGDSSGNASEKKDEEKIDKERAICSQCWKMITDQEVQMHNAVCKCTKTSLIHMECKDKWSQEVGETCSNCLQKKKCTLVSLSLKTIGKKP